MIMSAIGRQVAFSDKNSAEWLEYCDLKDENARLKKEWFDMNGECNSFRDENYKQQEIIVMSENRIKELQDENAELKHVNDVKAQIIRAKREENARLKEELSNSIPDWYHNYLNDKKTITLGEFKEMKEKLASVRAVVKEELKSSSEDFSYHEIHNDDWIDPQDVAIEMINFCTKLLKALGEGND
jgi:hypothetical protein